MSIKVKGEAIKEGSIPMSALTKEVKDKIDANGWISIDSETYNLLYEQTNISASQLDDYLGGIILKEIPIRGIKITSDSGNVMYVYCVEMKYEVLEFGFRLVSATFGESYFDRESIESHIVTVSPLIQILSNFDDTETYNTYVIEN